MRAEKLDGAIMTRITFSNVVYAKGWRNADSLVLTMCGGEVDGVGTVCDDEPTFTIHQRYIVLAKADLGSHKNMYSPIVYMNQGVFALETEKPGGSQVVRGIIGYRDGPVLARANKDPPTPPYPIYSRPGVIAVEFVPDTGTRFTEKEFLRLIRKIAAEQ